MPPIHRNINLGQLIQLNSPDLKIIFLDRPLIKGIIIPVELKFLYLIWLLSQPGTPFIFAGIDACHILETFNAINAERRLYNLEENIQLPYWQFFLPCDIRAWDMSSPGNNRFNLIKNPEEEIRSARFKFLAYWRFATPSSACIITFLHHGWKWL